MVTKTLKKNEKSTFLLFFLVRVRKMSEQEKSHTKTKLSEEAAHIKRGQEYARWYQQWAAVPSTDWDNLTSSNVQNPQEPKMPLSEYIMLPYKRK
jgi:hypothetical protein